MSIKDREKPINVALLISGLSYGGAERQVIELANNLTQTEFSTKVIVLTNHNPMAGHLRRDLHVLAKKHKFDVGVALKLRKLIVEKQIDLVHSFLFDANIAARIAKKRDGWPKVICSERNSFYD